MFSPDTFLDPKRSFMEPPNEFDHPIRYIYGYVFNVKWTVYINILLQRQFVDNFSLSLYTRFSTVFLSTFLTHLNIWRDIVLWFSFCLNFICFFQCLCLVSRLTNTSTSRNANTTTNWCRYHTLLFSLKVQF